MSAAIVNEKQLLKELPGLTLRQLRRLRAERRVPYIKIGHRSFVYDPARVLEALRKLEVSN